MTSANRRTSPADRIDFIDLLRGWAVLVMIETHVANATLSAETVSGPFFQYLKFINGLVAPSFLFASGIAYAVTTRRKAQDYLSFGKPLFKQLWRIVSIALIGYLLHVPIFSARRLFIEATTEQWQSFFQVDVLQCIAVSLLILQILLLLLRDQRRLYITALVASIAIVVITPAMWEVDFWPVIPWPIAAYLNGVRFSLFPLLPWAAFLFAGGVTGHYFMQARERGRSERDPHAEPSFYQTLLWLGGSLIMFGFLIDFALPGLRARADYWMVSPAFFSLRLGIVMILCAGAGYWTRLFPPTGQPIILLFGRESLLIYVFHLLLLYGDFGPFNLISEVNKTFGYFEAALLTTALVVLMFGTALVWNRTKTNSPRLKRAAIASTIIAVVMMFLFGDG